jgi:protein TonB
MFPAPSRTFDRRAARAVGERRPIAANRIARRSDAAIRVDIAALETAGEPKGPNGFSVGLPESFFHTASGETVHFVELPTENEAVSDGRLEGRPDASAALAPSLARPETGRTKFALFASVAIHLLAAASLLTWMNHGARISGGTPNEIAGIGNASADQTASGDAVNVTITTVPVVKAQPVELETLRATAEPSRTVEEMAAAEPVREMPAEAAPVVEAAHVEAEERPVAAAEVSPASRTLKAAQTQASAVPAEAEPVASVSDAPEILATPTFSDSTDAAPAATMLAEALPEHAPQKARRPPEAIQAENAVPAEILPPEEEPRLAEHAPVPTPRPERIKRPVEKAESHAPEEPHKKKPARTAARTSAPGSGGRDSADAKRGVTEGKAAGRAASSDDNSRQANAAGNAAVSNYPGKVVARLRRALRYPSEARSRRLNGTVQVQFVVGRSGDVGSVRLAASSGSPVLDKAALATVQRAAPFPPIPEGAGRSSWTFTVPLAFVR